MANLIGQSIRNGNLAFSVGIYQGGEIRKVKLNVFRIRPQRINKCELHRVQCSPFSCGNRFGKLKFRNLLENSGTSCSNRCTVIWHWADSLRQAEEESAIHMWGVVVVAPCRGKLLRIYSLITRFPTHWHFWTPVPFHSRNAIMLVVAQKGVRNRSRRRRRRRRRLSVPSAKSSFTTHSLEPTTGLVAGRFLGTWSIF